MPTYHVLAAGGRLPDPIATEQLIELYRHPDPGDRPWVRTNFVSTLDGSTQGPDGRAGTINTASDRYVYALQRALSDVILVGAGTARAEHYHAPDLAPWQRELRADLGLQPYPTLAIVSAKGRLTEDVGVAVNGEGGPVLILTSTAFRSQRSSFDDRVEVAEISDDAVIAMPDLITALHERGLRRVLCEGGARLAHALHAAELVDELCLTFSPMIIGGDGVRSTAGPLLEAEHYRLAHCIAADDHSLLLRYLSTQV